MSLKSHIQEPLFKKLHHNVTTSQIAFPNAHAKTFKSGKGKSIIRFFRYLRDIRHCSVNYYCFMLLSKGMNEVSNVDKLTTTSSNHKL